MADAHRIAVVVGSLRRNAHSLRVAQALKELARPPLQLEILTLHGQPFYDQDSDANPPAEWTNFRNALKASDGVIIVTPEYNRSVTGALKNAIDIASRPYGHSALNGRPVGIIGNSPGAHGGVSAVKHLQGILPGISGPILQQPEMYLGSIGDAFDESGKLTKDSVRDFLQAYLTAWEAWVVKHKPE